MRKHKHKRSASLQDEPDDWTEHHSIVGTKLHKINLTRISNTVTRHLSNSGATKASRYVVPESPYYPEYRTSCSGDDPSIIPFIQAFPAPVGPGVSILVGPQEGFFECQDSLHARKKIVKEMNKLVNQNPNALKEDDSPYVKYDLGPEEVKLKVLHIKEVERKLKSVPVSGITRETRSDYTDHRLAGKTIDTYAFDAVRGEKAGQPNADSFYAEGYGRILFFGVADGIGWGIPSRRASQAALLGFSIKLKHEVNSRLQKSLEWDAISLSRICFEALANAHIFVNAFTEAKTTICGGAIVQLAYDYPKFKKITKSDGKKEEKEEKERKHIDPQKRWMFVGISVGDTLIYRYSKSFGTVKEITVNDRTFGVRDAGGSLGGPRPDHRNLGFYFCLLEEGDFVIAVSDGVHDNLDPEILLRRPSELGHTVTDDDWKLMDPAVKNNVKREFKEMKLAELINSCDVLTSENIVSAVVTDVITSTHKHRAAYEEGSILQLNWDIMDNTCRQRKQEQVKEALKKPMGKFDHVTCLCLEVSGVK